MELVDEQTGLANRRAFHQALLQADGEEGRPLSIVLVNVDRLEAVNHERGEAFGARLLNLVSALLPRVVPEAGLVARVGGDEFALLLEGIDAAGCESIASDIEAAARHHPGLDGHSFTLTVRHASCPPAPTVGRALRRAGLC